ncbi:TetR family transcriptional regulator [Amycolatopsis deserti]|uniref:TetR family transcriptional regulator n=1 Tax=Amycolatopsis deserti TaxID=185696 RepID=A0ABQ3IU07_9PSEU|nr:TetR family transcriptional regulator [Amycolatopsis deserti]
MLDATERVLVRDGGDAVTIAAVAREAGVSKGGLFYHFASKELLIEGLIARYVASFDELIATAGDEPGAATLAYLRSAEQQGGPASQPVIALLAAAVVNPRALETLRDRYQRWQHRLNDDGLASDVATTIRFAVDGLWLADTLDLAPARGKARQQVIERLRTLIQNHDT